MLADGRDEKQRKELESLLRRTNLIIERRARPAAARAIEPAAVKQDRSGFLAAMSEFPDE